MGRFKSDFNQSEGSSESILFSNVYRYISAARKRILAPNISINPRLIIQLGVNKLIFWLLISVDMKSAGRSGFARESSRRKMAKYYFRVLPSERKSETRDWGREKYICSSATRLPSFAPFTLIGHSRMAQGRFRPLLGRKHSFRERLMASAPSFSFFIRFALCCPNPMPGALSKI